MKKVVIYTFNTCPFCVRAKRLMDNKGVSYEEIDITTDRDELKKLEKSTQCATVPQIFVNDEFIGGCDDIIKLHKEDKFDGIFK